MPLGYAWINPAEDGDPEPTGQGQCESGPNIAFMPLLAPLGCLVKDRVHPVVRSDLELFPFVWVVRCRTLAFGGRHWFGCPHGGGGLRECSLGGADWDRCGTLA